MHEKGRGNVYRRRSIKSPHPESGPDEVIGFDMNSTCMQTGSIHILIDYFKYLGRHHSIDMRGPGSVFPELRSLTILCPVHENCTWGTPDCQLNFCYLTRKPYPFRVFCAMKNYILLRPSDNCSKAFDKPTSSLGHNLLGDSSC